jgi:hypothetical protein
MNDSEALPITPEGVGELAMHYGEALAWIRALEAFIVQNGLRVPTWADTKATQEKS